MVGSHTQAGTHTERHTHSKRDDAAAASADSCAQHKAEQISLKGNEKEITNAAQKLCSRCRRQRRCRRRCLLVCPIARQQFISARSLLSSDATSAATQRLLLRSLALLRPRAVARASLVEGERRPESALRRRCSLSVCLHVCVCSGSACVCCALLQQQRRVLALPLSLCCCCCAL